MGDLRSVPSALVVSTDVWNARRDPVLVGVTTLDGETDQETNQDSQSPHSDRTLVETRTSTEPT